MNKFILAYDIGTSGVKASLYRTDGQLIDESTSYYKTYYDNHTGAEQDPNDWWNGIIYATKELDIKDTNKDIIAISFSGQESGLVLVDKDGHVLRNSMIHCDMRAVRENSEILQNVDDEAFFEITGHKASPSYTLQKFAWVKKNEPEIYHKTYKILNAKDYIIYKLTGQFITDYTDASFTNMYDINLRAWSARLCQIAGIDMNKLPEIKPSTYIAGRISEAVYKETGIKKGTPIVLGAGDGQCASIGCGAIRPGKIYNSIGTSSWITVILDKPPEKCNMCLETAAHPAGEWANSGGTMQTAGASYDWAVNTLYGCITPDQITEELMNTKAGSGGVIFLPYLNGERVPWWDNNARGTFVGITNTTQRADMLRAVLEGVAYNLKIILDVARSYNKADEIIAFGGMTKSNTFCQILADVYGIPVVTLKNPGQITSLGAAIIGGVAVGEYKDFDIAEKLCQRDKIYSPITENVNIYKKKTELLQKCYFALKNIFKEMSED